MCYTRTSNNFSQDQKKLCDSFGKKKISNTLLNHKQFSLKEVLFHKKL